MHRFRPCLVASGYLLALPFLPLPAGAATVTLPASADTTLFSPSPNNNLGNHTDMTAGTNRRGERTRALVRFDVAGQVPAGAIIVSASVTMNIVRTPSPPVVNSNFDLRRVLRDWTEGTKTGLTGQTASPGETTWINRAHPDQPWDEPGGAVGADFSGTVSATTLVQGSGFTLTPFTFTSTPELVADVQAWVDDPAGNFGWGLMTQQENTPVTIRRIGSSEGNSGPMLTVEFEAQVQPPMITGTSLTGGQLEIQWTEGSPPFGLQSRPSFSDPWEDASAEIDEVNRTAVVTPEGPQRFFRVRSGQ